MVGESWVNQCIMARLAVRIAGFPNNKLWKSWKLSSWLYYISVLTLEQIRDFMRCHLSRISVEFTFERYASIHSIAECLFRTCQPVTMSDLVCPNEHNMDRNWSPMANCKMIMFRHPSMSLHLAWMTSWFVYLPNVLLVMPVCSGRLLLFKPHPYLSSTWEPVYHLYLLNFRLPVELPMFITPSKVLFILIMSISCRM